MCDNYTIDDKGGQHGIWDKIRPVLEHKTVVTRFASKSMVPDVFTEVVIRREGKNTVRWREVLFSLRGKKVPTRAELEQKDPVNVVDISEAQTEGSFADRRKAILAKAQETIKMPYLNKDTGAMIFLTWKSYTHLFNNIGDIQLNAAEHLPELVENAILTHAETPTHGSEYADKVYTFFAAAGANERVNPVKLKVKEYSYKSQQLPANVAEYFQNNGSDYAGVYDAVVLAVEDIEKDLSSSAKPLTDKSASMQRPDKSSAIKVADLLNLVKGDAKKYIPQLRKMHSHISRIFSQKRE